MDAYEDRMREQRVLAISAATLVANVWLPRSKKIHVSDVLPRDVPEDKPRPVFIDQTDFDRYMAERERERRAKKAKKQLRKR